MKQILEKIENNRVMERLKQTRFAVWFESQDLSKQVLVAVVLGGLILSSVLVVSVALSPAYSIHSLNPSVYMIDYPGEDIESVDPGPDKLDIIVFPTFVSNTDQAYSQQYDLYVQGEDGTETDYSIYEEYTAVGDGAYYKSVESNRSGAETYTETEYKTTFYRYQMNSTMEEPEENRTTYNFVYSGHPIWEEWLRSLTIGDWHAVGTTQYNGEQVIVYKSVGIDEDNQAAESIDVQSYEGTVYVASKEVTLQESGEAVDIPVAVYVDQEFSFIDQNGQIQTVHGEYTVEQVDSVTVPEGASPDEEQEDTTDDTSEQDESGSKDIIR